ncbi:MAG: hypothetical protein IPN76_26025 [Saprospiraceae bacterium]|nr:hypothetical protein [Saprospiraceae bacterium]
MKKLLPTPLMALLIILPFEVNSQCVPIADSLALVALYDSTNGAGWTNNTNWLVSGSPLIRGLG